MTTIPTFDQMMNPLLQALEDLGGSGTIEELDNKVAEIMDLSDQQLEVVHNPDRGGQSEVSYRLAWTRTYLKKYGLLENSSRGVWALTAEGRKVSQVNPHEVKRRVREEFEKSRDEKEEEVVEEDNTQPVWRDELLATLQDMDPAAFERLAQRLLRESGFIQVEVLGKSGDGGIDGKGILRLGGLLGFHVYFQCKRYTGSVGSAHVRDFRGAMMGRADKGLIITTGSFTRDAEKEASRDGASPIDLIDGVLLADKLKELGLGVETKIVEEERVTVDHNWFKSL